jgi:hypothetical protein
MKRDFSRDFTGCSFIAAALMLWTGWILIPVHINLFFTPEDFSAIGNHLTMQIWMYRVHIFGMIVTVVAMTALASLFPRISSRVLVYPGAAVIAAGMAASALGAAFFYQFGASGAVELRGMSDEVIGAYVTSLKLDTQYAGCFFRFGRVFTGLGMVIMGAGLIRSKLLPSWTGISSILIGMAAMAVIMAFPDKESFYYPIFHLLSLWLAATGGAVLKSRLSLSDS